jgi:hypothetical protein
MADSVQWTNIPFKCDQGSRWRRFVRFWEDAVDGTPFNFTDYEWDMHIREGVADSGAAVLAHLSSRSGSDEDQRIFFVGVNSAGEPVPEVTDRTSGMVMFQLSAADTQAMRPAKIPKKGLAEVACIYDAELSPAGGDPEKRMQGEFLLNLEVTRR